MVQAINKIHINSSILNSNEGVKYIYNGRYWIRNENIELYKFIDKTINETGIDPASIDRSKKYYIELSEKYNNNLLQSELLTDSVWSAKNLTIITTPELFTFPTNANPCFNVKPTTTLTTASEFYLSQEFLARLSTTYVYSMFVKHVDTTEFSQLALTVKDMKYNIMVSIKFDLNEINADKTNLTSNIKYYNSLTLEEISSTEGKKYFSNCTAGILRLKKDNEYFYRPYIIFKVVNDTNFNAGINILNEYGDYKYIPQSNIRFFMSGGQLEQISNKTPTEPAPYMITFRRPVQHINPYELWTISGGEFHLLENNHIHYLISVEETEYPIDDEIYKRILTSKPELIDYNINDIAVIQNTISFGTDASLIKKTYPTWAASKYYKVNEKVIYQNNLYKCNTSHTSSRNFTLDIQKWDVILDAVGLGFNRSDIAPVNSIYYDKDEKVYKIRLSTPNGDKWVKLNYNSTNKGYMDIVHAMTYGQGRYQTWDEIADVQEPLYIYGLNTGGNYNFVKLSHISNNL